MKLAHLINEAWIVTALKAKTLAEAVPEILRRAGGFTPSVPLDQIEQAVLDRERLSTTALAKGLAAPHARIEGLNELAVLVGVPAAPLADKGMDGKPVDLIFLIVGNTQGSETILQTLAAVAALGSIEDLCNALRAAKTPHAFWHVLNQSGLHLKKGVFAADFMLPCPVVVTPATSLKDLLDSFAEHHTGHAPVVNDHGKVIGYVSSKEIITAVFPDYMFRLHGMGFMSGFEPIDQFYEREKSLVAGDIMNPKPLVVTADDALIQVVFRMHAEERHVAWVERDGKLAGQVTRADLILRLLRT